MIYRENGKSENSFDFLNAFSAATFMKFIHRILLEAIALRLSCFHTTHSNWFHHDKYIMQTHYLIELLQFAQTIYPSITIGALVLRAALRPDLLSEVIHRSLKNSQAASCLETSSRCLLLPLAFHLLRATELSVKSSWRARE